MLSMLTLSRAGQSVFPVFLLGISGRQAVETGQGPCWSWPAEQEEVWVAPGVASRRGRNVG